MVGYWANNHSPCHRSRSRGVGARYICSLTSPTFSCPVATFPGVAPYPSYHPPLPLNFFYRIAQLLYGFALCGFHLIFGLVQRPKVQSSPIETEKEGSNIIPLPPASKAAVSIYPSRTSSARPICSGLIAAGEDVKVLPWEKDHPRPYCVTWVKWWPAKYHNVQFRSGSP